MPERLADARQQEVHAYYVGAASSSSAVVLSEDHLRLDVKVMFPTPAGSRDVRVLGVVADTGAQVNIFPARLLRESGLQLFGLTTSKLPTVKSASGAKVRVTGSVNVQLSAAASSGERFKTSTKVYIADVKDFLSFDVLRV